MSTLSVIIIVLILLIIFVNYIRPYFIEGKKDIFDTKDISEIDEQNNNTEPKKTGISQTGIILVFIGIAVVVVVAFGSKDDNGRNNGDIGGFLFIGLLLFVIGGIQIAKTISKGR